MPLIHSSHENEFDVAIVGLGPVGAVAANLLGQAGLRVAVIERHLDIVVQPRAMVFDDEIARVFQQIGLATDILRNCAPMLGAEFLGRHRKTIFKAMSPVDQQPLGYAGTYSFFQPELETVLREGLSRFPQVHVYQATEALSFVQDGEGVTLKVSCAGVQRNLRSRWLLGCDGARSIVRKSLGQRSEDLGFHRTWLCLDVELLRPHALPEFVQQVCLPEGAITYVPGRGQHRRWEIAMRSDENEQSLNDPDRIRAVLAQFVNPDDCQITRAATYTFHALIAPKWRDGRVFLLGDAAHTTPPFLGQGMCSGIRDAHNLAAKLISIERGHVPLEAREAWLDAYQQEREPHFRSLVRLSIRLGKLIQMQSPSACRLRDSLGALITRLIGVTQPQQIRPRLGLSQYVGGSKAAATLLPQPRVSFGGGPVMRLDHALADWRDGRWLMLRTSEARHQVAKDFGIEPWIESLCLVVDVLPADHGIPSKHALLDIDGELFKWLRRHRAKAALIRPDRYVHSVRG